MTKPHSFLPYGRQEIDDDDIAAVAAVLKSNSLTTGPVVEEFERALADVTQAAEVVVCSSGTAALHLSMLGLGLQPGDRVVVPTLTFLATANCARYVGADVVFADVNPNTGLMEADHLEKALLESGSDKVKAVIPVHLNGQCCDMATIKRVAERYNIAVVEDACHALGGTYASSANEPVAVGACAESRAACLSFHPVKTIAMGEGGAVTTNDATMAATMRRLRSHGMDRTPAVPALPQFAMGADGLANPWFYEMVEPGWNYRASDIHCALGLSQLKKLQRFVTRRAELVARYDATLKNLAPFIQPIKRVGGTPAWHLYVALIDFEAIGQDRAAVMRRLALAGIGTQVHYFPVHLQPYYQRLYGRQTLAGAERYYERCLSLPLFPAMHDADVDHVVAALAAIVRP